MRRWIAATTSALTFATVLFAPDASAATPARSPSHRWVARTPDAMLARARERALDAAATDAERLAGLLLVVDLAGQVEEGVARRVLAELGSNPSFSPDLRAEALLLEQRLAAPTERGKGAKERALGIATELAVLGPFHDTGGGLDRPEGPEAQGQSFGDASARYAWGAYDVGWRRIPSEFVGPSGAHLGLFVHPRRESCSYVATKLVLPAARAIVARLAAAGQVRLSFDGAAVARSDDVHAAGNVDRLAVEVDASAGAHLVTAKVCAGALGDDGHLRLRFTDADGAPLAVETSSDLSGITQAPAPKFRARATPLERTLARAAGGADDAAMAAIVARTIGGADDLRSPRAPGLLDAVTRGEKDPDRLAMAACLAPPGANRTGWLHYAKTRAEEAGDADVLAFTQRKLVAAHLAAGLPDYAVVTLRSSGLERASDPEALLLRAKVAEGLGTSRRRAALAELAALLGKPDVAPTALLEAFVALSGRGDARARLVATTELARRGQDLPRHVEASQALGQKAVREAAKRAFDGNVESADDALRVAGLVVEAGDHATARTLFETLARWAPNRPETFAGLAAELALDEKQADRSLAALRRARALGPGEAQYRARLELRTKASEREGARDDERHMVASDAILARRLGVPAEGPPDVADRELHWLRAVVMHDDRRVSQLIHYAREVVVAPRTEDELLEDLPAEGDLTEILRARVHRPSGEVVFPTEEHNEGHRPRVRWPELRSGDVVEVAIRSWTEAPVGGRGDPPFYFMDYAGAPTTHPLLFNEVIVEAPKEHPIFVDVLNGREGRREESEFHGRHVTRLVWDRPTQIPDEPLAPQLTELVPVAVGSTFKGWDEFRAWYKEAVRGFTEPDEQVRRLARELTRGKTTRDARLAALFNFVADDIRYVNYQSAEYWLPNRPQQVLARREGDCDDKAILLITLLRAVGIEAQEVLVQTRHTGQPSVLRAKNVAIPLFDHGIAFLPGPGGGTWLDATSPQSRLGPLPSMDGQGLAMRVDTGPAVIEAIPGRSPRDHGAQVRWTVELGIGGEAELRGEERHSGDSAFTLRTYATEPGARAQFVEESVLSRWLPTVEVDKAVELKPDVGRGEAVLRYRAHSDGFARQEGDELVVPLGPTRTLASELAPLLKRTLPVSLPPGLAPSFEQRSVRFLAPRGLRWAELPAGGDEDGGEFGRARLALRRDPHDGRAVLVERSIEWRLSFIAPEKYLAWRAWVQRVDALFHKQLRLVPSGKGGAP